MNTQASLASALLLAALAALPATAQTTLNWTGGTGGGNSNLSTSTNWAEAASPSATTNLVIATRNGTGNLATSFLTGADYTIRSITFDNAAGKFTTQHNVQNSTASNGAANRILTFGTGGIDIITTSNFSAASNIRFRPFGSTDATLSTPLATFTITLGYSGQANINTGANSTVEFDGALINGSGGINKTGAGTLTLGGIANTFTGGLTVSSGTVTFATANRLGSESSLNASALVINGGVLSKTGAGSTTSVSNRGVQVGSSVGTINVADAAGTLVVSGVIADVASQAGNLTKTGAGTLALGATNTFTGGLTINGGVVAVDSTTRLGSAASTNTNAIILANGTLQFTAASGTFINSANRGTRVGNLSSVIEVTNAATTLRFQNSVRDVTGQAGVLTKTGAGALSLEGNFNTYTGGTQVNAGTLLLNGITLSAGISVADGATLRGGGTIGGTASVFATGSTVDVATYASGAQSAAVGSLTFNNNLTLGDATLLFDLDTVGASDRINLGSGAVLDVGAGVFDLSNFSFSTLAGFGAGTYTLLSSSSSIVGSFGSSVTGTLGGFDIALGFGNSGQSVDLVVSAAPVPEPASCAALAGLGVLGLAALRRRRA